MEIKFYAHGVPNGQSIWGNPDTDAQYIETFYGRKSNVPSQMLVEVMQFAGKANAYYTYFCHGSFQDNGGRPGGYFALTLRIDHYYRDIQNIYNLLEAAFNKYVVGSVLEQTNGGYRFLVSQLKQQDKLFSDLEKELKHYLLQFSSDSDFVSLAGFKSNGQNECSNVNLLEATPSAVMNCVKSVGKVSVSSLYPSAKEQQIISKYENKIKAIQDDANRQIATIKSSTKSEAERIIGQYSTERQTYKAKYEHAQSNLDKANKIIADIKKSVDISSGHVAYPDRNETPKRDSFFMNAVKKLHPFVDFFLLLLLICMVSVTLISKSNCSSKAAGTQPDNDSVVKTDTTTVSESIDEEEQKDSLKYIDARIDIAEISATSPMQVSKTYTVSLKGVPDSLIIGTWESEDFTIYADNRIMPKKTGTCTITYVVNNQVVKSRTLEVKQ